MEVAESTHLSQLDRPEIISVLLKGKGSHREAKGSSAASEAVAEILTARSRDGTEIHCRVFRGIPQEPHILFFPAEYDSEAGIIDLATGLGHLGITLITMDYRGCRASGGEPSISALPQDAEVFYKVVKDWCAAEQRTGPVVFMGRSLGAAIALDLACRHDNDSLALIMESAFDSTEDFLSGKGIRINESWPSGEDPFSNRSKMSNYSKAVLFLHSHRDEVVSLNQIEWLVAESRSKATQLQIVPSESREDILGKAGDVYFTVIKDFLNRRMGRRPPSATATHDDGPSYIKDKSQYYPGLLVGSCLTRPLTMRIKVFWSLADKNSNPDCPCEHFVPGKLLSF